MDIKTILIIGIAILSIGTASAATSVEPLSSFNPLIDFDENIVAGDKHFALFEFTAKYDTTVVINFTVEHPEINEDEWCGLILFDEIVYPDEVAPGVFSTGEVEIDKGYYLIQVQYKSDIAVVPGKYNFSLDILSENILIEPSRKSSGGFGGSLPMPTPNATAEPGNGGIPTATARTDTIATAISTSNRENPALCAFLIIFPFKKSINAMLKPLLLYIPL